MKIENWKLKIMRLYQQAKNIYHWLQAHFWRSYYRWPDRKLTLYGVTGTNGKTTTCLVLGSILRAAHGRARVGLLSTEVFWLGVIEKSNDTHMTSTDARVVFGYLRQMLDRGATHAVLEMTSHALDQNRLAGLRLSGAIILNIAHEHLDYHGTMEEYATAKGKIVNYLKPGAALVAKGDDRWVRLVLANYKLQIPNAKQITKPKARNTKIRVVMFTREDTRDVRTPLPGEFNKENVLAASLLAGAVGMAPLHIAQGVAEVTKIPGRVEWIDLPNGARAVVDFALTPYSYERLFKYLRGEAEGRLFAVFGAAGRRDKAKRPLITNIVAQYADEIILTQDEPYDDPEEEIYEQLEAGLVNATITWRRIPARREAIKYAMQKSKTGDVIAVTGMGNYNVRIVRGKKIPWNDREVILDLMNEIK